MATMEQTRALNALEPFVAQGKTATTPQAAADIITQATSAPNTYLFTELLQLPQIQALGKSIEYSPYLTLLEIFSYGTYATYVSTPNLPSLSPAQALKLRQLSILTLAGEGNPSYDNLIKPLHLSSPRDLEFLITSCIYASLIRATLDPANSLVQIDAVAPLRDLAPGAVPGILSNLKALASRCDDTLAELEAQIASIRITASEREFARAEWDSHISRLVDEEDKKSSAPGLEQNTRTLTLGNTGPPPGRNSNLRYGKRGHGHMDLPGEDYSGVDDEAMDLDVDEGGDEAGSSSVSPDGKKRSMKRKLQG